MQDNEKKPALRFKGFTDPWEQRKLGDLCVEFRSGEFISASDITETGEYPVFGGNGLRGFTDRFNHDGEYTLIGRQGALCGNVNFAVGKSYFTEHAIAVRADKKNQTRFLYYLFSTMDLGQYSGQSAQPGLAVGNLVELKSTLPDKQEQEKISGVLTALDTLITLHQRKYEKLVNIKKSMLDKMFPQNGASVPEIRFKGFTDPWEQRKVGTLIEDYTEKTVTQNQYPVLTSSQQQGIVLQEDYFADRQVTTDNNVGYYVLPKGYFTYRSRSDTDVFVFNRNNIVDKGIISYYYPVFAPKSCDSNFLLRRLNHGIKKQLSMAAEGTGQKVLAHAKFKNMVVDVPSQSEQEKIGTILEELDTLITLHQREHIKPILEVKRVKRNE